MVHYNSRMAAVIQNTTSHVSNIINGLEYFVYAYLGCTYVVLHQTYFMCGISMHIKMHIYVNFKSINFYLNYTCMSRTLLFHVMPAILLLMHNGCSSHKCDLRLFESLSVVWLHLSSSRRFHLIKANFGCRHLLINHCHLKY